MKLGIMQPYFFPYLGYFSLIDCTDKWIVFDDIQYIERGWVNRNRIIHPNKPEASYITVPLKSHRQTALIKDVAIKPDENYTGKILGQLTSSYKKRAPYFNEVYTLAEECLCAERENLSALNVLALDKTCRYIGLDFNYEIFSKMDLTLEPVNNPGDWALNISKALNADEYINPPGGAELFDRKKFEAAGINLSFVQNNLSPYNQRKREFISGLSIIDVMMFNSPEETRKLIRDFSLILGENKRIL